MRYKAQSTHRHKVTQGGKKECIKCNTASRITINHQLIADVREKNVHSERKR